MSDAAVVEDKGAAAAAGGSDGEDKGAAAAGAAGAAGAGGAADKGGAAAAAGTKGADKSGADKSDDKGQDKGGDPKGYWPEDWLVKVTKGDEKVAKQLGRYASPEALAEAHIQLRRRMDSGEFKAALPKNPTEDDLKAWRKDNGIPEKAAGYDLKGISIEEVDKPVVDAILEEAHKANYSTEQARTAVRLFYQIAEGRENARLEQDETERGKALDALSQEWGGQFTRNKNLIGNVLSRFPQSVRDGLMDARLPDGTLIFNVPDIMRGFLALELERNPTGIVTPGGDGELGKGMVERYQEIQKMMREDRKKYDKDEAVQKEYRTLIDAMIKHGLIDRQGNLKKAA